MIAFVDSAKVVHGLYATPNYSGTLFDSIRTGMTGAQARAIRPTLRFWGFNGSMVDNEVAGFFLKHEDIDLDEDDFLRESFRYIAVFSDSDTFFL